MLAGERGMKCGWHHLVEPLDEFVSNGVASVSGAENDVIGEFGERAHGFCRRFAACG